MDSRISLFSDRTVREWTLHSYYQYVTSKTVASGVIKFSYVDIDKYIILTNKRVIIKYDEYICDDALEYILQTFVDEDDDESDEIKTASEIKDIHFVHVPNDDNSDYEVNIAVIGKYIINLFKFIDGKVTLIDKFFVSDRKISHYYYHNECAIALLDNNYLILINYYNNFINFKVLTEQKIIIVYKVYFIGKQCFILDVQGDVYHVRNRKLCVIFSSENDFIVDIFAAKDRMWKYKLYLISANGTCFNIHFNAIYDHIFMINGKYPIFEDIKVKSIHEIFNGKKYIETEEHVLKEFRELPDGTYEICSNGVSLEGRSVDNIITFSQWSKEERKLIDFIFAINSRGQVFLLEYDENNVLSAKKITFFSKNPLYVQNILFSTRSIDFARMLPI